MAGVMLPGAPRGILNITCPGFSGVGILLGFGV